MNTNLALRLSECNITVDEIMDSIIAPKASYGLFIYTSHIENLGTSNSDFDIYVICNGVSTGEGLMSHREYSVQQIFLGNSLLDVEYWDYNSLLSLISKVNSLDFSIDITELKLLHRISYAEFYGNNDLCKNIKQQITNGKLNDHVTNYYSVQASSFLEDAVYMYNAGYLSCASSCAYKALDSAIGLLNAQNGKTNLKGKWISKIFLDDITQSNEMKQKYYEFQLYPKLSKDNLANFLEEKIEFIQDILAESSIF